MVKKNANEWANLKKNKVIKLARKMKGDNTEKTEIP